MKVRQRIIDVHAHVIPGVDDGSRTMEESVEMLKRAADQGIVGVIATPHYSRRHVLKGLNDSAKLLQQEIRKTYPKFRIFPGQETFYHDELAQRLNEGKAYNLCLLFLMKFFFRGSANWSLTGTRLFLLIWSVTVACEKKELQSSLILDVNFR